MPEPQLRRQFLWQVVSIPLLAACGAPAATSPSAAARSEYVVAPLQGSYGQLATDIARGQPMADFLAKETGYKVRSYAPGDYTRTVGGLNDGSLDLAFLPSLLYLRAHDESGAQALFRTERPGANNTPTSTFTSIIAVRADSGIGSLTALRGKKILGSDPSDAAGYVFPAAQIKKAGLDIKQDVTLSFAKSGSDALVQVLNKKADAALAAKHDLADAAVLKADPAAAQTLKLLTTTEGAPLEVVAARKGIDSKALDKFKAALKALGDSQKATFSKDGKSQPILAQWGVVGLVEAKDADFAALREAAKTIGVKLK